jgi:membrane-associated phospholipid phosphatase
MQLLSRLRRPTTSSRVVARVGVLPLLCLGAVVLGGLLHARFFPQASYTWARPANILRDVVTEAYFPLFALAVFALGFLTRVEGATCAAIESQLRSLTRDSAAQRRWLRAGALAAGAVALASWLVPTWEAVDLVALAYGALYLGLRRPVRRDWVRSVGELALVVLLFTAVSYSFTVVKALLFQFGSPQDALVLRLESAVFGTPPHRALAAFATRHPWALWLADEIYYHLFHHMVFVSLFLVGAARRELRFEYQGSLAICYLLGGFAYHLFPLLGPAFVDAEAFAPHRASPNLTTHFQSLLLHNTRLAATGEVGRLQSYEYLAAMPSLHMAHELVMLWYSRGSRPFFLMSLAFTMLTAFSVVLLGWHYPTDVLAGAALALVAVLLTRRLRSVLFPAALLDAPRPAEAASTVSPAPAC